VARATDFFLQMFRRDAPLEYIVRKTMFFRAVQPMKAQIGGKDPNIASFLQKPSIRGKPAGDQTNDNRTRIEVRFCPVILRRDD